MRISPKPILILVASAIAALSLSALRPAPQMTVQNQDWTEYYSTNGRVLTVEYTRQFGTHYTWATAFEIPSGNNYSFEVTDMKQHTINFLSEEFSYLDTSWDARILRSSGVITPIFTEQKGTNHWRRTGVVMQPGDKLQVRSYFVGSTDFRHRVIMNGNVTR